MVDFLQQQPMIIVKDKIWILKMIPILDKLKILNLNYYSFHFSPQLLLFFIFNINSNVDNKQKCKLKIFKIIRTYKCTLT